MGPRGSFRSKAAAFRRNPREYKSFHNEKGQPDRVGLVVLVEAGSTERTSQRTEGTRENGCPTKDLSPPPRGKIRTPRAMGKVHPPAFTYTGVSAKQSCPLRTFAMAVRDGLQAVARNRETWRQTSRQGISANRGREGTSYAPTLRQNSGRNPVVRARGPRGLSHRNGMPRSLQMPRAVCPLISR